MGEFVPLHQVVFPPPDVQYPPVALGAVILPLLFLEPVMVSKTENAAGPVEVTESGQVSSEQEFAPHELVVPLFVPSPRQPFLAVAVGALVVLFVAFLVQTFDGKHVSEHFVLLPPDLVNLLPRGLPPNLGAPKEKVDETNPTKRESFSPRLSCFFCQVPSRRSRRKKVI
jgi:hypothetical protein